MFIEILCRFTIYNFQVFGTALFITPVLKSLFLELNLLLTIGLLCAQTLILVMADCPFLLIHLSYYIIAYYTEILLYKLEDDNYRNQLDKGTLIELTDKYV